MNQTATSIRWAPSSAGVPSVKSLYRCQRRKRSGRNGSRGRNMRYCSQSTSSRLTALTSRAQRGAASCHAASTSLTFPRIPDCTRRAAAWCRGSLRRCVPTWTTFPVRCTRRTASFACSSTVDIGFSTNTSRPRWVASMRICVCAKSGVATITASTSFMSSRSPYRLNSRGRAACFWARPALVRSRFTLQTSQRAAISTLCVSAWRSVCSIRKLPRLPHPTRPIRIRSLAPSTRRGSEAETARPAAPETALRRNFRLFMDPHHMAGRGRYLKTCGHLITFAGESESPFPTQWEVEVTRVPAVALLCCALSSAAQAQTPVWQNPALSFEERAADLVSRMTLEEKAAQMIDRARAIERLGIPEYNWWNEGLHGVARSGLATVFPQAIGFAATWNDSLVLRMATVISDEFRAKHHDYARRGQRQRYQGLTVWSANINLFRDPRWGRGQETYGEDPYLTARLAGAV